jgi:hypothetical protein
MFRFPNMTDPAGNSRSFDNEPSVTIPHEFNHGYDGAVDSEAVVYPEGFDGTMVSPRLKVFIFVLCLWWISHHGFIIFSIGD